MICYSGEENGEGSHSSKRAFILDPKVLEYTFRLNHVLCKARLLACKSHGLDMMNAALNTQLLPSSAIY